MQAKLQAKLDREKGKKTAKRHAELVKQADKLLKGGSREAALKILQEAFKCKKVAETLLKIAELQYQLDRYTAAVTSANLLISSQPSPSLLAAAQAVVQRCGTQAKLDEEAPAPPIDGHLDMVLSRSTAVSAVPRNARIATHPATRVETDPWASDTPTSNATTPVVQRSPSKEAISMIDALFARAPPALPSRPAAIVAAANPFELDESPSELPSWALPPPDRGSPTASNNPFAESEVPTSTAPGGVSESSTSLVVVKSPALAVQIESTENNPFADEPSNALTSTASGREANSSMSLVAAAPALALTLEGSADAAASTDRSSCSSGGTEILEGD
jgi:hypothetical protein